MSDSEQIREAVRARYAAATLASPTSTGRRAPWSSPAAPRRQTAQGCHRALTDAGFVDGEIRPTRRVHPHAWAVISRAQQPGTTA